MRRPPWLANRDEISPAFDGGRRDGVTRGSRHNLGFDLAVIERL
jgi:hypothetical protein